MASNLGVSSCHLVMLLHYCVVLCSHLVVSSCHLVVSSCHLVVSSCRRVISSSRVFLSLSSCPSAQVRLHGQSILVVPLYISGHYQRPPLLPVLAFFLSFSWLASLPRMSYSTVRCQVSWSSSRSFLRWSSVRWTETLPHCVWLNGQEVINRLYSLDVERGSFTLRNSENVFHPHSNNFKTHN